MVKFELVKKQIVLQQPSDENKITELISVIIEGEKFGSKFR